jgi:hypothetical protein
VAFSDLAFAIALALALACLSFAAALPLDFAPYFVPNLPPFV